MKPASRTLRRLLAFSLFFLLTSGGQTAHQLRAADATADLLRPAGIDGVLVLGGGGTLPDAVFDRFTKLAGGDKAHLVIVADGDLPEKTVESWKARQLVSVVVFEKQPRKDDRDKLLKALQESTGVWFADTDAGLLTGLASDNGVANELQLLLKRGGVLGTANGAGALGHKTKKDKKDKDKSQSFDLLPGAVVVPHFTKGERLAALFETLDSNPGLVGFGIDDGTALIVQGREVRTVGDGKVTICLAASTTRKQRTIELKPAGLQDLTALRRAAIARSEPPFPPKELATPDVPNGTLIIIGGGGTPPDALKKFIELAGGPDGPIVVLPQAYPDPIPDNVGIGMFQKAGATNVKVLHGRTRSEIDDPKNLEMLMNAKGVWFDGGRQWRFVDALEGTKALEEIRGVLKRGGVIGGSSAGASIQAEYMCRGDPLGNLDIMAEGYERGLGFLPGVAVDQHFTQRKRFDDMTGLMKTYPQLLGIGIDEATAIVVHGSVADVLGKGKVHFYDRKKKIEDGKPDYEGLKAGERYDLKDRKAVAADKDK